MSVKISDTAYIPYLTKPRINLATGQVQAPRIIVLFGTVKSIEDVMIGDELQKLCSIEVPKWPLRLVRELSECFSTEDEAQRAGEALLDSIKWKRK